MSLEKELNTYYQFKIYYTTNDQETHEKCLKAMKTIEDHGHFYTAFDITECQQDFLKKMATEEHKTFPFIYTEGNEGTPLMGSLDGFLLMLDMSPCFRGTTDKPVHFKATQIITD